MALPSNIGLPRFVERAGTMRSNWELHTKPPILLDHVLEDGFWVNMLQSCPISAGDEIRVRAEDMSFCVDLMFVEIDEKRQWAKTRTLHKHWVNEAPASPAKDDDGYETSWAGPVHKWRVLSPAGAIVEKGFASREAASEWLREYKATRVAA